MTPAFQRSFAWAKPQVAEFWSDLRRAIDAQGGPEDYFLGLVVVDASEEIQDGQQRLASALLLATAIYERIEAAKESGAHNRRLAQDAIAKVSHVLQVSPSAPLVIGTQDQDVLLNRAGIRSDSPESAKRLDAARELLRDRLDDDLELRATPDAKLARLNQWGSHLRATAYVVLLSVPHKDAHNIFETLNTRGVRLSNGDLVKSHLISRTNETSIAIGKWNEVTDALKDSNGSFEADLESFLLHYYGSRYGRTTKAQFFADYRRSIQSLDSLDALDALIESAKLYRMLVDPTSSASQWTAIGQGAQQAVEVLNGLAMKQLRYLLLAVLRDLGDTQSAAGRKRQRDAVIRIVAWSVRGLVQGQIGGGEAEKTYIEAAAGIRGKQLRSVAHLREHFVKRGMLTTNDKEFERSFARFAFDRKNAHTRARAILYGLEYHSIAAKSSLKPRDTLTVEHVLPKAPAPGQWNGFSLDDRSTFTYKLGNLILIDGPSNANDMLANKEWPDKRKLIKEWTPLTPLTSEAVKTSDWTKSKIDSRTKRLALLASKAWAV